MIKLGSLIRENLANTISIFRMALAISVVVISYRTLTDSDELLVLLGLLVIAFLLDGVDGTVARRLGTSSLFGSFLDIFGDRVVEFAFIYRFYSAGLLPAWFPIIFYARILLTDWCRYIAHSSGKVLPSGILLPEKLTQLVLSPASRILYGGAKMILFTFMFALLSSRPVFGLSDVESEVVLSGALLFVILFSMLRGFPIIHTYALPAAGQLLQLGRSARVSPVNDSFSWTMRFLIWAEKRTKVERIQLFQVTLDLVAVSMFSIYSIR